VAARERVGADLIDAIQAGFLASESLPRLVDSVGIEASVAAADSKHGSYLVRNAEVGPGF